MSAFKFNFSNERPCHTIKGEIHTLDEIHWLESEEIKPDKQFDDLEDIAAHANMFTYEDVEIGYLVPGEALTKMIRIKNSDIFVAQDQHSDLIPGKYEGGLKIWECTSDLIEFLVQNKSKIILEKTRVLDLGCGAGLVGIYAFINGAKVTFQDYNKEVLEYITIPNVLLNIEEEDRKKEIPKCKFYSGDWASFNSTVEPSMLFDYIFTSETIYNLSNYDKLIDLFSKRLTDNGIIYVAAKTYYFGVGGGTREFVARLAESGLFKSEVSWKNSGGIQREILKITRLLK